MLEGGSTTTARDEQVTLEMGASRKTKEHMKVLHPARGSMRY
jgi:hypothetical protein